MRIIFIINGRSKKLYQVTQQISEAKKSYPEFDFKVHVTASMGDAFRTTCKAASKYDAFIVCGGGGTMNEVINGLNFSGVRKEAAIGLVPIGSANDYARSIETKSIHRMMQNIKEGNFQKIDMGVVYKNDMERVFANAASNGIGGLIFRHVELGHRSLSQRLNYIRALLICVVTFKRPTVKISMDGEEKELGMTLIAVSKGSYIGYGLGFIPQAKIDDGEFGVTILRHSSYYQLFAKLYKLLNNKKINHPWISYHKAKKVTIEVLEGRMPIETDGEYFDVLAKGESVSFELRSDQFKLV